MPDSSYDCIVIGSGPGGYVAAIRAAQLGMKTAVVERDVVGGRCLNYACIPAKAVLRVADVLAEIDEADDFGISVPERSVDFAKVMARREKVISTLTGGVAGLFKKNKIEYIEGHGSVTDDGNVKVGGNFDGTEIEAKTVILATGSIPKPLPGTEFGGRIIGTEEAWALEDLPETMVVAGAGASGVEIASAYGRLGTKVMLFEALDRVVPAEDADISKVVGRGLSKQSIDIHTGTKVENVETGDDKVTLHLRRRDRRDRVVRDRRRPRPRRRGPRPRGGRRQARRPRPDRRRRRAAHERQGRLRDRRPRARPRARPQGVRRGHHRRRGRRRDGDPPDRVRRHPARDVLHAQRRLVRPHRGAGEGAGLRRRRRQGQLRRGRRRHGLRRPRRHDQDHRRQEVRRADRRPHRRRPRDRADPGARERQGARGRLPRGRRASSTATPRCPRPSWRPRARPTAG